MILPSQNLIYEFEFQFTSSIGIWVKADVDCLEAFEAIKTGLLRNHPVSLIKLFTISEDTTTVAFIYDVTAAKQGNTPWTISASTT